MLHKEVEEMRKTKQQTFRSSGVPLPRNKDWRDENVISTVKDQGQCGSCWTFGSTETVESYWALATGQLPVLSQQFILDCTPNSQDCGGTGGCQGGTATLAINTIAKNGGIPQEWTYSYRSYFGAAYQCQNASSANWTPFARVSSQVHLPFNVEAPVIEALATTGPLITNVDASGWFAYEAGVFQGCSVNATIDHVVQLVGYGHDSESKLDYLLVQEFLRFLFSSLTFCRFATPGTRAGVRTATFASCARPPAVGTTTRARATSASAARRELPCAASAACSIPTRTSMSRRE